MCDHVSPIPAGFVELWHYFSPNYDRFFELTTLILLDQLHVVSQLMTNTHTVRDQVCMYVRRRYSQREGTIASLQNIYSSQHHYLVFEPLFGYL